MAMEITALRGMGEIGAGTDVAAAIAAALSATALQLRDGDVVIVTQKIISKAENRSVDFRTVTPSARALELAAQTRKDARLVELVLAESTDVVRAAPGVLITRHKLGLVMANAGIDRSNIGADGEERVLLLPVDPDASAERIRNALMAAFSVRVLGVIISDSFGRPWRLGTTNIAIGAAGVTSLYDQRGMADRDGRRLEVTQIALADALAGAAGVVMGEADEGTPVALVRGVNATPAATAPASSLVRPAAEDLFR